MELLKQAARNAQNAQKLLKQGAESAQAGCSKRSECSKAAQAGCNLSKMYFSAGFVGLRWGQEIVGRLGETRCGRLTKAFVTLSQTQQIRPISTLSQIRPISSRDRPLLRRTDKLPSWSSPAPGFLFRACLSFFNA